MSILDLVSGFTGQAGVLPNIIRIITNETLGTVVNTPDLLNAYVNQISAYDSALVYTTDEGSVLLTINYVNGNIGLKAQTAGGVVNIPTLPSHIAVYDNTNGGLSEDAPTAINAGNIQAGISGTAGYFISYPPTLGEGTFTFEANNNSGNFNVILSNSSHAQNTTYTILDGGQTSSYFITSNSSTTQTIGTGSLALTQGNLTLGSLGHASVLTIYPSGGAGTFVLQASINSSGDFYTRLTTDTAVGQNQVITIPNGGTALSNILLTNSTGTQTVATGNLVLSTGNLVLGSNGHASTFTIYPSGSNAGNLNFQATSNSGNFATIITNAAQAQATTYTIPDAGNASASILVASGATPLASGNLVSIVNSNGVVKDAGFSLTAGEATDLGVSPIVVFVASNVKSSSSIVVAGIIQLTDPAAVLIDTSWGTHSITMTFTAPPGAVSISYIALNTV